MFTIGEALTLCLVVIAVINTTLKVIDITSRRKK